MAENILADPVSPDAATTFVRQVPNPAKYTLGQFLPDKDIQGDRVEFSEAVRTARKAKYRAYDGNIPELKRDGLEGRSMGLIPMSIQGGRGEYERLQLEKLRQGGGANQPLIEAIFDDFSIGVRDIRTAVEAKRGELLSTGKLVINENGLQETVDFGVPVNHFATAATPWSDVEDSTPIEDLLAWKKIFVDDNEEATPGRIIVDDATIGYLMKNKEIRVYAGLDAAGGPQLVRQDVLNSVLAGFGIPPLYAYDVKIEGQRVIPAGKAIFVPDEPSVLGNTYWGTTATVLELMSANQTEMSYQDAPGIVAVVTKSGPPFKQSTLVDSVNLPILNQPKALFVGTVA